jgi:WD40 repeat protein/serine/threonine protein kinase
MARSASMSADDRATRLQAPAETIAASSSVETMAARRAAEDGVSAIWSPGDVILGLYEVKGVLGEGGMGTVYRVFHRDWNTELAVKSPKPEQLARAGGAESFVREAETWVSLGLHPHIVSCYYVRTLGGIPRVFAEYVEGGSLAEWIRSRRLYEGGPEKALERILDIAIQFAWGLDYAHTQGLVHQDVKPANVMVTPDGIAKVTDFGLVTPTKGREYDQQIAAGMRYAANVESEFKAEAEGAVSLMSMFGMPVVDRDLVPYRGMTPAYCSPEQAAHQPLSRRTDVWSWGVSVLEMFTGEVTWLAGQAAGEVLDAYGQTGPEAAVIPRMPDEVAAVLRTCFARDQDRRPSGFREVVDALKGAYQRVAGHLYPRDHPKTTELLADSLSNQAISLVDLGRTEDAERMFVKALEAETDHLEATYNLGLLRWRLGRISDVDFVQQMKTVRPLHVADWMRGYLLGLLHVERGDGQAAVAVLEEALGSAPDKKELQAALVTARNGVDEWRRRVRVFEGHTFLITAACVSHDGRLGLSGSLDGTLRIWDLSTGECVRTFKEPLGGVGCISLHEKGRYVASGADVSTKRAESYPVRVWDLVRGECVSTFAEDRDGIGDVRFVPGSGDILVAARGSKSFGLWSAFSSSSRPWTWFEGHDDAVTSVDASADGVYGLSGSYDKTVRLWDLKTGRRLLTLTGHTETVSCVRFVPGTHRALSASGDRTLRLWDLDTGTCRMSFTGHTDGVASVSVSRDGRWALSRGGDKTVRLWDVSSGRCVRTFTNLGSSPHAVGMSPDGRLGIWDDHVVGGGFYLFLWELQASGAAAPFVVARPRRSEELLERARTARSALERARVALERHEYGEALAQLNLARGTRGYEREPELLALWRQVGRTCRRRSVRAAWFVRCFTGHTHWVSYAYVSRDASWALSHSDDHTARVWDLETGTYAKVLEERRSKFKLLAVAPDEKSALTYEIETSTRRKNRRALSLRDLATGQPLWTVDPGYYDTLALGVTPTGRLGISADAQTWADKGYRIRIWDMSTGRALDTLKGHASAPQCLAVSHDGRLLLSGDLNGSVRLWDLVRSRNLSVLEHSGGVKCVGIAPDGRRGLSGGPGGTIKVWDLSTGSCIRTLAAHAKGVSAVVFGPQGRWAFSSGWDNTVRLWDLDSDSRDAVHTFEGHTECVRSIGVGSDGRWLLSGSLDKTLRLWELDWDYEFPGLSDWEDGASPRLAAFLTMRSSRSTWLGRWSRPIWSEEDFERLLIDLANDGYGWLRPSGIRKKLEDMTARWVGPPPLPGT